MDSLEQISGPTTETAATAHDAPSPSPPSVDVLSVIRCQSLAVSEGRSAREKVLALEQQISAGPRLELPVRNFIGGGLYCRELFIPAGVILTGHIHKFEHIAICTMGDISIFDETGLHRIKAGDIFVSKPGIKRAGYAHQDSRFINVLRMSNPDERDIKALEAEFVAESQAEYEEWLRLTAGGAPLLPEHH
jgi:quercetin dioxygenase-like cupin family protein